MNESIYILFISCYLEGVLKEEDGGGEGALDFLLNFNQTNMY